MEKNYTTFAKNQLGKADPKTSPPLLINICSALVIHAGGRTNKHVSSSHIINPFMLTT